MKVLVTGGAGFIGSNFIHYMLQSHKDYEIVNVDALTYCGNLDNLRTIENAENYRFIKGRIEDEAFINELFQKEQFDIVVNFAAETHVDRSLRNPKQFLISNIMGTQTLLEASSKYGVKRYHQVSTDEVYGELPLEDKSKKFHEDSSICPSSPYAVSKASSDMLVLSYGRSFGLPITISRCSNNYGPYQFPEKLIPLVISRAEKNQHIPIYGDGKNVRDWLYVEDHCRAIDGILHKGKIGEVYNIGGNNEYSNLEIVTFILELLNKPQELITFTQDRKGHDRRYAICPDKMEQELGWKPSYTFEQGIRKTITWYQEHGEWMEKLLDKEYQKNFAEINPEL